MEKKQGLLQQKYDFAHVLKLTLVATISCFLTGYNIGVVNSSLDNVAETLNWGDLKSTYISLCNALFAVGGTIGSMVSGKLANKYGRRKGMIICDYVSILSCICVFFYLGND